MTDIQMSFAMGPNPRNRAIFDGAVKPSGIDFTTHKVPVSELFWRQLKFQEFDVSEMSISSFLMVMASGDKNWIGLPVFTTRHFFHTLAFARKDSGINSPADYKGRRVGVPEFQQTGALWARGAMIHEFGCKQEDVEWWMERTPDHSHAGAVGFKPPQGTTLKQIPKEKNIGSMLLSGELDATSLYFGGGANMVDRTSVDLRRHPDIKPLFADTLGECARYYKKTGIYPINHAMIIRRSLVEKYPWAPMEIYLAMAEANEIANKERIEHMEYYINTGRVPAEYAAAIAEPIVQHGLKANRKTLETCAQYSHEQGLTPRLMKLEEIFAPSTLGE
ncbi:MAG TPA: ABC transporter substrate-binding protein [Stellaceae bacterium]|jgi:4,5-dihydroxyphthalate decarboxylase|nr:ABC transporter substrate-binding protein [Stellaceae bacterium]